MFYLCGYFFPIQILSSLGASWRFISSTKPTGAIGCTIPCDTDNMSPVPPFSLYICVCYLPSKIVTPGKDLTQFLEEDRCSSNAFQLRGCYFRPILMCSWGNLHEYPSNILLSNNIKWLHLDKEHLGAIDLPCYKGQNCRSCCFREIDGSRNRPDNVQAKDTLDSNSAS